jgi:hypothetical protein
LRRGYLHLTVPEPRFKLLSGSEVLTHNLSVQHSHGKASVLLEVWD